MPSNQDFTDLLGAVTGLGPAFAPQTPDNFYQDAAANLSAPARTQQVAQMATNAEDNANNTANSNAMFNVQGPMATGIQAHNVTNENKAGAATLASLDQNQRANMYNAADRDRQQQLAEKQARLEAMTNGIKTGATLLGTAAAGPLGGWNLLGKLGTSAAPELKNPNPSDSPNNENNFTNQDIGINEDGSVKYGQDGQMYTNPDSLIAGNGNY
jgi:hypothetical protein